MHKEIFFSVYYVAASFTAAIINTKIRETHSSIIPAIIMSQIYMAGGIVMLKYSDLSLIKQSAIITLMSRVGYLFGLVYIGENIQHMQWVGIFVMLVGTFLTNYK